MRLLLISVILTTVLCDIQAYRRILAKRKYGKIKSNKSYSNSNYGKSPITSSARKPVAKTQYSQLAKYSKYGQKDRFSSVYYESKSMILTKWKKIKVLNFVARLCIFNVHWNWPGNICCPVGASRTRKSRRLLVFKPIGNLI